MPKVCRMWMPLIGISILCINRWTQIIIYEVELALCESDDRKWGKKWFDWYLRWLVFCTVQVYCAKHRIFSKKMMWLDSSVSKTFHLHTFQSRNQWKTIPLQFHRNCLVAAHHDWRKFRCEIHHQFQANVDTQSNHRICEFVRWH